MTFALYLGRRFLRDFIRVFLIVVLLIFLVELLETIRRFSSEGASFENSVVLALTHMPVFMSEALPMVIMLASLTFCVSMARSNEFVVARSAGLSAMRSLRVPVILAFLLGIVAVLVFDPLAAKLDERYEVLKQRYLGGPAETVTVTEAGVWMRQKTQYGHVVVNALSASQAGAVLHHVSVLEFDSAGRVSRRVEARTAYIHETEWLLADGKIWQLGRAVDNPELRARPFTLHRIPLTISQAQILEGYPAPEALHIWELPAAIAAMERAGFSSVAHRVHLQMQIVRPVLFMAMLLIGAIFTLQNARLGNLGISVLLALLFGFSMYFLQNLALTLGQAGEIPAIMAAWIPPVAALLMAYGLLLHLEDG